jgi:predicted acyltransferase
MSTATLAVETRVEQTRQAEGRLYSLDLFRGMTIAAMIVVNNQSSTSAYWALQHAAWNGATPTDFVFPFFLFIVGVSLVFSLRSRISRGESRRSLVLHTLRRTAILFALGLALNALFGLPTHTLRIPGVLQRIAVVYCAAMLITMYTKVPARLAWAIGLLVGYWVLLRYLPVPGYGIPGRDIPFLDPDLNLAAYLDRKLLMGHLWEGTRDPEGILSTLPAIATALAGVLTGDWLISARRPLRKTSGMLGFGLALVALGALWAFWFPVNKKLWTSSYVLLTAGCALICFALCYWITDIKHFRGAWTKPLIVFGTNAIASYVLSEVIGGWLARRGITFLHTLAWMDSPALVSLIHSMVVMAMCLLPMWWLHRKRIFLKI